jgi:hypothetical protein
LLSSHSSDGGGGVPVSMITGKRNDMATGVFGDHNGGVDECELRPLKKGDLGSDRTGDMIGETRTSTRTLLPASLSITWVLMGLSITLRPGEMNLPLGVVEPAVFAEPGGMAHPSNLAIASSLAAWILMDIGIFFVAGGSTTSAVSCAWLEQAGICCVNGVSVEFDTKVCSFIWWPLAGGLELDIDPAYASKVLWPAILSVHPIPATIWLTLECPPLPGGGPGGGGGGIHCSRSVSFLIVAS